MERSPLFAYQPIGKAASEIRILNLHPGMFDEPLVATLTIEPLSSVTDYEALSYAWGNANLRQEILLNDSHFSITENAATALNHLRREDTVRRIWIDAVCINQLDNNERLHQVQHMDEIYRSASRVLVWLGPALQNSDSGINLLRELAHLVNLANRVPTQKFDELPVGPLRALLHILDRPYWKRTWIVQEVAVALSDPVIGCGHQWLDWNTWKDGVFQLYRE
jgi:Heterokaryon incompatibility protein (HET)